MEKQTSLSFDPHSREVPSPMTAIEGVSMSCSRNGGMLETCEWCWWVSAGSEVLLRVVWYGKLRHMARKGDAVATLLFRVPWSVGVDRGVGDGEGFAIEDVWEWFGQGSVKDESIR